MSSRAHAAAAVLQALARQQGVPLRFSLRRQYAAQVAAPIGCLPAAVQACVAVEPPFLSDADAVSVPWHYCVVIRPAAQDTGGLPLDKLAKAIVCKGLGRGFAVRECPSPEARSVCAHTVGLVEGVHPYATSANALYTTICRPS